MLGSGSAVGEAYGMITRMVVSELALLASLAIRPPEKAALMQAEAGLYAGALLAAVRRPLMRALQRGCVRLHRNWQCQP
jgi:hypothetical protein